MRINKTTSFKKSKVGTLEIVQLWKQGNCTGVLTRQSRQGKKDLDFLRNPSTIHKGHLGTLTIEQVPRDLRKYPLIIIFGSRRKPHSNNDDPQ